MDKTINIPNIKHLNKYQRLKKFFIETFSFIKGKRSQLLWGLGPILSFILVEYMIGNITFSPLESRLDWLQILLNLVWYYMFAGFVFLLVGWRNLSAGITAFIFFFIGNVECYVYHFRWRVIFPSDLMAAGTALDVVGNYDMSPCREQIISAVIFLVFIVLLFLVPRQKKRKLPRPLITLSLTGLAATYIAVFAFSPFLNAIGMNNDMWDSMWDTKRNGILLNFTVNLKNLRVERPDGYSLKAAENLGNEAKAAKDSNSADSAVKNGVKPNVIVIMNESFADLSVLGNVETNADSMPFVHSLTENTVKGYAYSSVFGGHTASSEYEFITGNSMAFLPAGTVAYQMYAKPGDFSLGDQFKSLGYNTTFLHPYFSTGWNRRNVYKYFGFDNMYFQNDFWNAQYIRDYVSDRSNYWMVLDKFEKSTGDPAFIFNVTMQNHGGYSAERKNLEKTVYLTGKLSGKYVGADTYLSLVRESDSAFEYLISRLKESDEPTIVLMFGDHQPNLGDEFYEDIYGKSQDELTLDETAKKYKVPFVIWANYDIPEQSGIETSINYLSPLLMKTAGLPMTEYQAFLSKLSESIPVLTDINFREKGGKFTTQVTDLSKESQQLMKDYKILQYNGICDRKKRIDSIFYLNK